MANLYGDILKIDKKQHIVEGLAANSDMDRDQQIIDEDFLKRTYVDWCQNFGNVRFMHQANNVVGRVLTCSEWDEEQKGFYITVKISDPTVWQKILDKELNGFSIGIKNPVVIHDNSAAGGRLVDGEVIETSVVDIPSNYHTNFMVVKTPTASTFDESSNSWKVEKTSQVGSYEDLRTRLSAALSDKFGGMGSAFDGYIVATYPDKLIYCNWMNDKYFEVSYSDKKGVVTLGDPSEVRQEYVPVEVKKTMLADVYKRYYSDKEREHMDESDFAGPHRSYPITSQSDVDNAARLIGHADNPDEVKRRIIEIAHRKGFSIPDAWKDDDKVDKTIDTSSGLQPYNLEGDNNEKEEKTTVADEQTGMTPEETKAAISGMQNVMENMMTQFSEIRAKIEAMASQVDPDRDGDVDDTTRPETEQAEDNKGGEAVHAADQSAPNDVQAFLDNALKTTTADIIKGVSEYVDSKFNTITKSATADTDGIKGMVAGVQKMASDLEADFKKFTERLEVVEQSAQPPKGVAVVVEKSAVASAKVIDKGEIIKTVRANNRGLSPALLQERIDAAIAEFEKGGNN